MSFGQMPNPPHYRRRLHAYRPPIIFNLFLPLLRTNFAVVFFLLWQLKCMTYFHWISRGRGGNYDRNAQYIPVLVAIPIPILCCKLGNFRFLAPTVEPVQKIRDSASIRVLAFSPDTIETVWIQVRISCPRNVVLLRTDRIPYILIIQLPEPDIRPNIIHSMP